VICPGTSVFKLLKVRMLFCCLSNRLCCSKLTVVLWAGHPRSRLQLLSLLLKLSILLSLLCCARINLVSESALGSWISTTFSYDYVRGQSVIQVKNQAYQDSMSFHLRNDWCWRSATAWLLYRTFDWWWADKETCSRKANCIRRCCLKTREGLILVCESMGESNQASFSQSHVSCFENKKSCHEYLKETAETQDVTHFYNLMPRLRPKLNGMSMLVPNDNNTLLLNLLHSKMTLRILT